MNVINTFSNSTSTHSEIQKAGVKAMQITYGCGDTPLEKARFLKFQKQAAKGKINPDRLPPTEDATTQHSLRVHMQVAVWQSLRTSILDPVGKGWELQGNNKFRPKMLSGDIAPQNLLKGICCNCQEGDKQCQTACTKHSGRGAARRVEIFDYFYKILCMVFLLFFFWQTQR